MPRLPRISLEGAIYYVVARASQGEVVFKDKDDYKMYLDLVNKYKSQHKFKLFSYCLLPDQIELLIETGSASTISDIMHDLNSLYTKYYNGRYSKHGHLFESRFRSVLAEKAASLLELTRHIHLSPDRMDKKGVSSDYPYSSFHIYKASGIETVAPFSMADETREVISFLKDKENADAYEKYVLSSDSKDVLAVEKALRRGSVYGSESFKLTVQKRIEEHTEELQKAAKAKKVSPVFIYMMSGFVLLAVGSSLYLYISMQNVQAQYQILLTQKEAEFAKKTRFENQSPLALTEIDGTSWQIELVDPKNGALQNDTITFEGGRFYSKNLAAQGYSEANYLLIPKSRGVFQWQSVQTNEANETIYWQGLWQGDAMKGQMTLRAGSKESVYSFYSSRWSAAEVNHDV